MKYVFLFLLCFSLASAQKRFDLPDLIKNNGHYFEGEKDKKQSIKVSFTSVSLSAGISSLYDVEGSLQIGEATHKITGTVNYNQTETARVNDKSIQIYSAVLNIENQGVFKGSLALKLMPKLFNVIVFEGVLQKDKKRIAKHFDNSNQIMKYLESLK